MFNYGTKFAGLGIGTFPNFAAKNASGPTATDGFPYTADSVNDWIGFTQDLLNRASLTPNGQAEVSGASQLINALMRGAAQRPGDLVYTACATTALRAQNRLLDLAGQIISITGAYVALAANVYCGDAANPTANAFYKCDASGNRTTSGAYMKMPDCRGLFIRGAGANSVYKGANDAPYDGGSIGKYISDAIRNITGALGWHACNQGSQQASATSALYHMTMDTLQMVVEKIATAQYHDVAFNAGRSVPVANENRPASISAVVCIAY